MRVGATRRSSTVLSPLHNPPLTTTTTTTTSEAPHRIGDEFVRKRLLSLRLRLLRSGLRLFLSALRFASGLSYALDVVEFRDCPRHRLQFRRRRFRRPPESSSRWQIAVASRDGLEPSSSQLGIYLFILCPSIRSAIPIRLLYRDPCVSCKIGKLTLRGNVKKLNPFGVFLSSYGVYGHELYSFSIPWKGLGLISRIDWLIGLH